MECPHNPALPFRSGSYPVFEDAPTGIFDGFVPRWQAGAGFAFVGGAGAGGIVFRIERGLERTRLARMLFPPARRFNVFGHRGV